LNSVISFELIPPTVDEMASRITATLPPHPYLVAEEATSLDTLTQASIEREKPIDGRRMSPCMLIRLCTEKGLVVRFISSFYQF
jgi:hypothetical protein